MSPLEEARAEFARHRAVVASELRYTVIRNGGLSGVSVVVQRVGRPGFGGSEYAAAGWAARNVNVAADRALRKLQRQEERRERVIADELRLSQYGPEAYL